MTENEEWRAVVGFEGRYEVSNIGRVRSVDTVVYAGRGRTRRARGRVLSLYYGDRYPKANLKVNGKQRNSYVHILVAAAFLGPCPEGMEVCHNNGDRLDNRPENLRYDTHSANMLDRREHGTAFSRRNADECVQGHPYTVGSYYFNGDGKKICRTCDHERGLIYRAKQREAEGRTHRPDLTHCKNGHPFDGHNGRQKTCSACTREARLRYEKRKAERVAPNP